MEHSRRIVALEKAMRLQAIVFIGIFVVAGLAMGGANAVAKTCASFVETDAWKVRTLDAQGTPQLQDRITVTQGVTTAKVKVLNGNVELAPQNPLPSGLDAGAIGYESTTSKFKVYNGSTWVEPGPVSFREFSVIATPQTVQTWSNQPAGSTEIFGLTWNRHRMDLTGFTQFRLVCNQSIAGATGSKLWLEYSSDQSAWTRVEEAGGTTADLATAAGTGVKFGTYANIASASKADLYFRLMGSTGGSSTGDPAWRYLAIQVK